VECSAAGNWWTRIRHFACVFRCFFPSKVSSAKLSCRLCRSRTRLTTEYRERQETGDHATRNLRYVRTDSAFGGIHWESIGVSESRPDSPVGNVLVHYRRSEIEFPRDGGAAWRRAQARIKSLRPPSKPQPLMKRTALNVKDSPLPFPFSSALRDTTGTTRSFASSHEIVIRLSLSLSFFPSVRLHLKERAAWPAVGEDEWCVGRAHGTTDVSVHTATLLLSPTWEGPPNELTGVLCSCSPI